MRSDDFITDAVPPGIYFRLNLGGATGHKAFARDLGVLLRPEELMKVRVAVIRVYITHGNRADRKKARLKHLLEIWPLEKYLEEMERLLGYKLLRVPAVGAEVTRRTDAHDKAPPHPPPHVGGYGNSHGALGHTHVGVFPQKQPGLNWIGVVIPVGNITPKQMLRLADLTDHYGSGEVRLTVWQNLVIRNIPDAFVETVKKALVKMDLHWQQSNLRSGLVACTGNSYCKFASYYGDRARPGRSQPRPRGWCSDGRAACPDASGASCRADRRADVTVTSAFRGAIPGGKMPPSTAAKMAAATASRPDD